MHADYYRNSDIKERLFSLVTKKFHPPVAAKAATASGNDKQNTFRYAVLMMNSFFLVCTHNQKAGSIHYK